MKYNCQMYITIFDIWMKLKPSLINFFYKNAEADILANIKNIFYAQIIILFIFLNVNY